MLSQHPGRSQRLLFYRFSRSGKNWPGGIRIPVRRPIAATSATIDESIGTIVNVLY
jgi:hypothetical protein